MVCNKIGYYLKLLHSLTLKRMNVEFNVDEFGAVWLVYAYNIVYAEQIKS